MLNNEDEEIKAIANSLIKVACLEILKEPPVQKKIHSPNGNNNNNNNIIIIIIIILFK